MCYLICLRFLAALLSLEIPPVPEALVCHLDRADLLLLALLADPDCRRDPVCPSHQPHLAHRAFLADQADRGDLSFQTNRPLLFHLEFM